MKQKKPGIAAVLNLVPGLGYLYLGTRRIFAILLLASIVLMVAIPYLDPRMGEYTPSEPSLWDGLAFLSLVAFLAAFVVDAYLEAKRVNAQRREHDQ